MQNKKSAVLAVSGIEARWVSSAKSGLCNAINAASKIAFMLSHGILNEVYYPHEDMARIRDMGWIVIDGKDFISETKRKMRILKTYILIKMIRASIMKDNPVRSYQFK